MIFVREYQVLHKRKINETKHPRIIYNQILIGSKIKIFFQKKMFSTPSKERVFLLLFQSPTKFFFFFAFEISFIQTILKNIEFHSITIHLDGSFFFSFFFSLSEKKMYFLFKYLKDFFLLSFYPSHNNFLLIILSI